MSTLTNEILIDPMMYGRLQGFEQWMLLQIEKAGGPVRWLSTIVPSEVVRGQHYEITGPLRRVDLPNGRIRFCWGDKA